MDSPGICALVLLASFLSSVNNDLCARADVLDIAGKYDGGSSGYFLCYF